VKLHLDKLKLSVIEMPRKFEDLFYSQQELPKYWRIRIFVSPYLHRRRWEFDAILQNLLLRSVKFYWLLKVNVMEMSRKIRILFLLPTRIDWNNTTAWKTVSCQPSCSLPGFGFGEVYGNFGGALVCFSTKATPNHTKTTRKLHQNKNHTKDQPKPPQ
jgi:hypothetical protein